MISAERKKVLIEFISQNNLCFNNFELLDKALTHSSYTFEKGLGSGESYERLEFLGDAVLKIIASKYLYDKFADYEEGELTKIRAILVSDNTLAKFALSINLGEFMKFGASEKKLGGSKRKSNLACAFEAILGALYLEDENHEQAKHFLSGFIDKEIDYIRQNMYELNAKTILQEYTQEKFKTLPSYEIVKEEGPAHKKTFEVNVMINGEVIASSSGSSKKSAQQNAAYNAILKLGLTKEEKNIE